MIDRDMWKTTLIVSRTHIEKIKVTTLPNPIYTTMFQVEICKLNLEHDYI